MMIVTVQLVLDVDTDGECFDGVNEMLRGMQRGFQTDEEVSANPSCLIDYAIDSDVDEFVAFAADYEEGDAFHF